MELLKNEFHIRMNDGAVFRVLEFVTKTDAAEAADPKSTAPGMERLATEGGLPVRDNGDGTFTIETTGQTGRPF
ncbi:hypothetical protein [Qipengyuania oceanensis]|uniref:Uncharacterized protein n=1 Tax=Qipengyuania oceanensis TaxID=1463597 RepID=A0A844YCW1_9SPHN|nr:hypothetical protein [Qipengyuania oceanensis]MXO61395.1 hypothetical protein [Qipengyuania oceanensis]